jgi:heavy metal sensor kinase
MASLARIPLRWRVTLVAILVQAVLLAALGAFVSVRLSRDLTAGIDSSLSARATQLVSAVGDGGAGAGNFSDSSDVIVPGLAARESLTQVVSRSGVVLESAGAADADQRLLSSAQLSRATSSAVRLTQTLPELGRTRLLAIPTGSGKVVVVGNSLSSVDQARSRLRSLLGVGGVVALLIGGGASWWLAGRALRPIDRLSLAAASIGGDDLDRRVPVPPTGDEAARMARTLNRLLERISASVGKERAFLADASHELRTPVAVLRAELEVALRSPSTPASARGVLESMNEETGRLSRLTDDLLALARADAGRLELVRKASDLAVPAERAVRLLSSSAARRGVSVSARLDPAPARIDPDRIAQVAVNLMDNAIRHSPAGGTIEVETGLGDGQAFLSVTDEGSGIPDELAERIFERFSRGDSARGRESGGTGLGLAIALAIAEAHSGSLALEDRAAPGSRFVLRLPAIPP